jgi:DNA-binding CsgD family transcriptional regulator/PAS domain-containing protein
MGEHQRLTRLIAHIYDAALDSTLWPDVLPGIAEFANGRSPGLLAKDSTKRHVNAHWHAGIDPDFMRLYAETYSKLGPVATSACGQVGEIFAAPDLVPYDEFCGSRFYREWAAPQGWIDVAVAVIDRSATGCAYLTIARDDASGMVDDTMRERMALVVPHVRRAVLIGRAIEFKQAETAAFADILDGLSAGFFLVDANGRIAHANAAGHDMLSADDFLRSVGGRLVARDADADRTLRETAAASAAGDDIGMKAIALPLSARNGERYVAHLLPLSAGTRRRTATAHGATAALFVRKATMDQPSSPEAIGKTYNLTPAELRVLLAIVEIGGVPEVADALGVAESTIKTHLGRLFEKTGAGRQADLVKIVAGFSAPLVA